MKRRFTVGMFTTLAITAGLAGGCDGTMAEDTTTMTAALSTPAKGDLFDAEWALSATGEVVKVDLERVCHAATVNVSPAAEITGGLDGKTMFLSLKSAVVGEPDILEISCRCVEGDAQKCTPIWAKDKVTCVIEAGCTDCKRNTKKKKKKKDTAATAGAILIKSAFSKKDAEDTLVWALPKSTADEKSTCDKPTDKQALEDAIDTFLVAVNGLDGVAALTASKDKLPAGFELVAVKLAGKLVVAPVKSELLAAVSVDKKTPKPTYCSCEGNSDSGACELESEYWGKVYYCENESCDKSCTMHFGKKPKKKKKAALAAATVDVFAK